MKKAISVFLLSVYFLFAISAFTAAGGTDDALFSVKNSVNENLLTEKEFAETFHLAVSRATRLGATSKQVQVDNWIQERRLFHLSSAKTSKPHSAAVPICIKNRVLRI